MDDIDYQNTFNIAKEAIRTLGFYLTDQIALLYTINLKEFALDLEDVKDTYKYTDKKWDFYIAQDQLIKKAKLVLNIQGGFLNNNWKWSSICELYSFF